MQVWPWTLPELWRPTRVTWGIRGPQTHLDFSALIHDPCPEVTLSSPEKWG